MPTAARISPQRLLDFAAAIYLAHGVPDEDARLAADTLVQADLWGHQSHGVMRLSWYVGRLRSGVMKPVAAPSLIVDAGALAVIDGGDAMGQVLAWRATNEVTARAKAHGVGVVGLRNSNHFGTAMYYTLAAARQGCVALLCTNASPAMAPWGGRAKAVGNNPWSIAAPTGSRTPMVLDIANTAVARGKIYLARQRGLPIPLGWALDAEGTPTTDPVKALAGILQPMGEHKGYGIALMMDVLAGVLTGSAFGRGVHGPYQTQMRSGAGHLMIALDVAAFQPLASFEATLGTLIDELKSVPLAPGASEILYPGELEARNEARHRAEGLELPDDTLADLERLAEETGLRPQLAFG
jgi:LDH2 family malate/lactate/ureidoglycolate dehydrogenase